MRLRSMIDNIIWEFNDILRENTCTNGSEQILTFVYFYSLSAIDTLQPFFSFLIFDTVSHALKDIHIRTKYVYNCHHHRKRMQIFFLFPN